jgi:4-hydroxy-3-methylbut-2-enyl diphosphate reductase IspH
MDSNKQESDSEKIKTLSMLLKNVIQIQSELIEQQRNLLTQYTKETEESERILDQILPTDSSLRVPVSLMQSMAALKLRQDSLQSINETVDQSLMLQHESTTKLQKLEKLCNASQKTSEEVERMDAAIEEKSIPHAD